ncbi:hypothetical protein L9F63_008159, partial [Diploptera punctata]
YHFINILYLRRPLGMKFSYSNVFITSSIISLKIKYRFLYEYIGKKKNSLHCGLNLKKHSIIMVCLMEAYGKTVLRTGLLGRTWHTLLLICTIAGNEGTTSWHSIPDCSRDSAGIKATMLGQERLQRQCQEPYPSILQ